jgi:hypothetical protein
MTKSEGYSILADNEAAIDAINVLLNNANKGLSAERVTAAWHDFSTDDTEKLGEIKRLYLNSIVELITEINAKYLGGLK